MKKLIMAVAVVCAAVASEASAFKWTTSATAYAVADMANLVNGQHYTAGGTAMKDASGWSWSAEITLKLVGGGTEDIDVETIGYNMKKLQTANIASELFELPTDGSTKQYSWDITITGVDAKGNKLVSDVISGGPQGYSKSSAATIASATPSGWTYTAVPEPTSGLLLLLGVAGLALRRRRA